MANRPILKEPSAMPCNRLSRGTVVCRRLVGAVILLGLAGPVGAKQGGLESALDVLPVDAPAAVIVPSLSRLNTQAAQLNKQALGSVVSQLSDILGTFKHMTGFTEGLDDDGPMVIVATSAQFLSGQYRSDQPPVIVVAPVTDYSAFVTRFGGRADEAVTSLTLSAGSQGFAKKMDRFAVIGPNQDQVRAFEPGHAAETIGQRLGASGRRCLQTSDVALILNVDVMKPTLQARLEAAMTRIHGQLKQMPQGPPAIRRVIESMVSIYGDSIRTMLRDTSVVTLGLDLTAQGVGLTNTVQFKPDSYLAKIFTTGGGAAQQLARLPQQRYWLASAASVKGIAVQRLMEDLLDKIPQEEGDPLVGPLLEAFQHGAALVNHTKGFASVYVMPDQPPVPGGGGLFSGVTVYETSDGQAFAQSLQTYFGTIQKLLLALDNPPPAPEGAPEAQTVQDPPNVALQYTPNALQIDGVQVDEYQIQYKLPMGIGPEMGPVAPMMMMMGGTRQGGYVAAKGPWVIMTTSRDAGLVKKMLDALGQDTGLGTRDAIGAVRQRGLPAHTVFESYISIPGIMDGVNLFLSMMGQPPMAVPEALGPIALASSVQDHGLSGRLYVPTEVIRFCRDMIGQTAVMQGGDDAQHSDQPHNGPRQGPPPAPF